MKLRKVKMADVPRILEWMVDPQVNQFFRFDPLTVTTESVEQFVQNAQDTEKNMHLAVVDDHNQYLGTVSLKEIDTINRSAEYAISMRKEAHGTGASTYATIEILRIAFFELNLNRVYLNVLPENIRANKFYEKIGFVYEGEFKEHMFIKGKIRDLKWYRMLKDEYIERYNQI